jgi:hypothetical protein
MLVGIVHWWPAPTSVGSVLEVEEKMIWLLVVHWIQEMPLACELQLTYGYLVGCRKIAKMTPK